MTQAWGRNKSPLNKHIHKSVLVVTGDFLFRFIIIDTPKEMPHMKFLSISYNRLISLSNETPLENPLHVNYLNIIFYKYLVQASLVTALTALWLPLI